MHDYTITSRKLYSEEILISFSEEIYYSKMVVQNIIITETLNFW